MKIVKPDRQLRSIRRWILFFMIALLFSGITAIPIDAELELLLQWLPRHNNLGYWLQRVLDAYTDTKTKYPFLLYGYDWLAFTHIILAILFVGPYRDPVRNIWVLQFGLISCVLILPLAFIAGYFRGIPIGWQLIDCSFGVIGFIPLWICYQKAKVLETQNTHQSKTNQSWK